MGSTTAAIPKLDPLLDQIELVVPTTVAGTFYGVAFTLYCLYIIPLAPRLNEEGQKMRARFMLGYSTVVMLCGLYSLVSNAWVAQDAYINYKDYPGGSYSYERSTFSTQLVITVGFICQLGIDILTSAIQVWRVWVIWSASRYSILVAAFPFCFFLTFTSLRLRAVILKTTVPPVEAARLDSKTEIVASVVQGVTTVLCTMMISLYLVFERRRQEKLIGQTQGSVGYMRIVALLVESYVLESAWLLAVAILWTSAASNFFGETVIYIEIICYLLVQCRVARGNASESQRGQTVISSLNWNHSPHVTQSDDADGSTSTMSVKPEAQILPVSTA